MRIARLSLIVLILALAPSWRGTASDAAAIGSGSSARESSPSPIPSDATLGHQKGPATIEQLERRPGTVRARLLLFALAIAVPLILGARTMWLLVRRSGPGIHARSAPIASGRSPPYLQAV